jgi:hypothetical protein
LGIETVPRHNKKKYTVNTSFSTKLDTTWFKKDTIKCHVQYASLFDRILAKVTFGYFGRVKGVHYMMRDDRVGDIKFFPFPYESQQQTRITANKIKSKNGQ